MTLQNFNNANYFDLNNHYSDPSTYQLYSTGGWVVPDLNHWYITSFSESGNAIAATGGVSGWPQMEGFTYRSPLSSGSISADSYSYNTNYAMEILGLRMSGCSSDGSYHNSNCNGYILYDYVDHAELARVVNGVWTVLTTSNSIGYIANTWIFLQLEIKGSIIYGTIINKNSGAVQSLSYDTSQDMGLNPIFVYGNASFGSRIPQLGYDDYIDNVILQNYDSSYAPNSETAPYPSSHPLSVSFPNTLKMHDTTVPNFLLVDGSFDHTGSNWNCNTYLLDTYCPITNFDNSVYYSPVDPYSLHLSMATSNQFTTSVICDQLDCSTTLTELSAMNVLFKFYAETLLNDQQAQAEVDFQSGGTWTNTTGTWVNIAPSTSLNSQWTEISFPFASTALTSINWAQITLFQFRINIRSTSGGSTDVYLTLGTSDYMVTESYALRDNANNIIGFTTEMYQLIYLDSLNSLATIGVSIAIQTYGDWKIASTGINLNISMPKTLGMTEANNALFSHSSSSSSDTSLIPREVAGFSTGPILDIATELAHEAIMHEIQKTVSHAAEEWLMSVLSADTIETISGAIGTEVCPGFGTAIGMLAGYVISGIVIPELFAILNPNLNLPTYSWTYGDPSTYHSYDYISYSTNEVFFSWDFSAAKNTPNKQLSFAIEPQSTLGRPSEFIPGSTSTSYTSYQTYTNYPNNSPFEGLSSYIYPNMAVQQMDKVIFTVNYS